MKVPPYTYIHGTVGGCSTKVERALTYNIIYVWGVVVGATQFCRRRLLLAAAPKIQLRYY